MVTERITDGRRIGELLSSELSARSDSPLSVLSVTDADTDAEASEAGTYAYAITREDDATRLAEAFVHPDRLRLEFRTELDAVSTAVSSTPLRARPKDDPPRLLVFLSDGAAVKHVLPAVAAAV
ncbi:hypothetical protein [Halocatena salina]|uniref:DUF7993 domain-containing protein n=1 Tax=Halocatena salina TaxID=2934340 RepID=A0A8U0A232_9EURY|nr:hypothetical protein [Halocatena salina]UPM42508.1 hypothetical protein MW046_11155 [Halocatena salina]